jgi:two-component system chemotaxis sensor kinase CheA
VLGSGDLALILDPGSIAVKAGIAMGADEEASKSKEPASDSPGDTRLDYLIVDVAGRQAAMPLADVLRIEQLPASRIEYIGYRPVLNFEGQVLPVEDTGGLVAAAQGDPSAQLIVVVCREAGRHVGIAVSHVLDVAAGSDLFEAGTAQRTGGVTLLQNRVTGVVDLAGVAPLAAAPEAWNGIAESRLSQQQYSEVQP